MLDDEILHKWVNGSLNAEELELFKNRPEYDSLVELYKNTENLSVPAFEEESMLAEILKKKKVETPKVDSGKRRLLSSWVKYAAAASVLLLGTWFFWPKDQTVLYKLAKGETKEAALPDQSTFRLNEESTLSYNEGDWEKNRTLDLKGEAFFSVKKGSKFTVKTPNGSVQVLGTAFNVRSFTGGLEVKCKSGKVAILATDRTVLDELNPSDVIRIEKNKVVDKWQMHSNENADWNTDLSSFKNAKLSTVLKELERKFTIKIDASQIDVNGIITCRFRNDNLETALKVCLTPLGIKHRIEDGNRVVLENE